jgi:tetratricopeptide (TPR) repeat protein
MKLSQARFALMLLVCVVTATTSGCSAINKVRAKNELNEAARAYKSGKFGEAEQRSRRALELDESQPNAPAFIARSIHAQYRQGISTPENIAKAEEAIKAYEEVLHRDPNNEEAFNAIGFLYGAINQDEKQRAWIEARARNEQVKPEKRSDAFTFLASKDWDCSFRITENNENKVTATNKEGKAVIQFKKPKDPAVFSEAQECLARGMANANKAIELNPDNEKAWGYKTNLLLEAKKLAEMDGKTEDAAKFGKEADEAQKRTAELNVRKREAEEKAKPPQQPTS